MILVDTLLRCHTYHTDSLAVNASPMACYTHCGVLPIENYIDCLYSPLYLPLFLLPNFFLTNMVGIQHISQL